ncbi:MAG: type III pantothenate kinase [Armatimonadota bacterium]
MNGAWRLYVDVGNSALKWGARVGERWLAEGRLPIERLDSVQMGAALSEAGLDRGACAGVALVSSRPSLAERAERLLAELLSAQVRVLGRDLFARIEADYRDPSEIGQDRLAGAEGARALHGVPAIVLTLGTCLTAQALDDAGRLVGGIIAAGLEAQVRGIAAMVPHLAEPLTRGLELLRAGRAPTLGHSTAENLAAGLRAAMVGTIDRMAAAMRARVGEAPVIATGGDAELAQALGAHLEHVEPLLVLEGLRVVDERSAGAG